MSFGTKIKEKQSEFSDLLVEMKKFQADKTKYLSEFKIDNISIEESCAKADEYLDKVRTMAISPKDFQFNKGLVEFAKNEAKHNTSLLGSFDFKLPRFDVDNMKEIQFRNSEGKD
jgi:hypothetical protein